MPVRPKLKQLLEQSACSAKTSGDIDGDGRLDTVVLFTIERGNSYSRHMLVQLADAQRAVGPIKVGGRGERFVHLAAVAQGKVVV